jgi:hypothetical protein
VSLTLTLTFKGQSLTLTLTFKGQPRIKAAPLQRGHIIAEKLDFVAVDGTFVLERGDLTMHGVHLLPENQKIKIKNFDIVSIFDSE